MSKSLLSSVSWLPLLGIASAEPKCPVFGEYIRSSGKASLFVAQEFGIDLHE